MEFTEDPFYGISMDDGKELKYKGMEFMPITIPGIPDVCKIYMEKELQELADVLTISLIKIGMYKYLEIE